MFTQIGQESDKINQWHDVRKLAVEGRNDLSDGLGGTGGRRDNVVANGTTTAPVFHGRTVDGLLGGSG